MTDRNELWERQAWDTEASFAAFHSWLGQEQRPRSLGRAYRKKVGRERTAAGVRIQASLTWRRWYHARDRVGKQIQGASTWDERAQAYDSYLADQERLEWEARRRAAREEDWQKGARPRALADEMLSHTPQFLKTTRRFIKGQGGQPDREVVTIGLDGNFLLRCYKLASELQWLAVGRPVERHDVVGRVHITADDLAEARDQARRFEAELLGRGGST